MLVEWEVLTRTVLLEPNRRLELRQQGRQHTRVARNQQRLGRMLPFEQAVVFCDSAMFHERPDRVAELEHLALELVDALGQVVPRRREHLLASR